MSDSKRLMSHWRWLVLALLVMAPVLILLAAGAWYLWVEGLWRYTWWPMFGCLVLALVLGWYWQRQRRLMLPPDFTPPLQWTDRDRQAWQLVAARVKQVESLPPAQLLTLNFYVDSARELAFELARFYHPAAKDPIGQLTIPEILAAAELAIGDLADMVDRYLPGGHLLTIDHWKAAGRLPTWYRRGSRVWWVASAVLSPINTAVRYLASQAGLTLPFQLLQENVVAWFAAAFIHRVGAYLIDLNSGRLRVGARRYRQLLADALGKTSADARPLAADLAEVVITVVGQVKAGKSSLVNALLGDNRAAADVLPMTSEITRYELQPAGVASRLVLLDTVGYSHQGPTEDQLRTTREALERSDLVLLVLHARDPGRQPDVELLRSLGEWFASQPHLKMPPVLGVMTHIDMLSPVMEWTPPYDYRRPTRPKEQSIREAVEVAEQQLAGRVSDVVPVCAADGKVYGVREWLLPELVRHLEDARAVALLRCLYAEADAGRIRKLLGQLLEAGKQLTRAAAGKT